MMKRKFRYQPGDTVRVRSGEAVTKSIDGLSKKDGCLFMAGMWRYCGTNARIIKSVRFAYDEHLGEMCRTRVPLYVLDNAICDGPSEDAGSRCDRSCFFLWHEDWLERCSE